MARDKSDIRPVRLAFVGAGNRGTKYLQWVLEHPDKAVAVAVADSDPVRAAAFAEAAGFAADRTFTSDEALFSSDVEADAAVICTPEGAHFRWAMQALGRNWHLLLEKPVAPTLEECTRLEAEARRTGLVTGVCHVLRYHPYFMALRSLVASGELGRPVSVTHRVRVGIDRACHTFVRGPWADTSATSPVILSKCCHDVDILLWILGSQAADVESLSGESEFSPANKPAQAGSRCVACAIERECPYSAVDLYGRRRDWVNGFTYPTQDEAIECELQSGRYGRCVYDCGADAVDRQTVIFTTTSGAIVSLMMDFFTPDDSRITSITLTKGEIMADGKKIVVTPLKGEQRVIDFSSIASLPNHAGADMALLDDFITAVSTPGRRMRSDISDAIESHRVCILAEQSRRSHVKNN